MSAPQYTPDPGPTDMTETEKTALLGDFYRRNIDLISPFLIGHNDLLKIHQARVRQGWILAEKAKKA